MKNAANIDQIAGLSESEAKKRLAEEGYNELPSSKPRGILWLLLDVVREPMFLLLIACGVLYLMVGDYQEAVMLLMFVFVIMGITFYQNRKTERALEALRDLSSPRALVIRDGVEKRIAGREVVREDIIVLAEGDRIPADAQLLSCTYMCVDESLLTGESVAVRKELAATFDTAARPGGDGLPNLFSGTLVVQGKGIARVHAVGAHTELGKIGKALQTVKQEETRLSSETRRLVRNVASIGVVLCVLVVAIYGFTRGDWRQGFLAGITLAMAIMPEEFPVVLTIFMALGAWRMSRKNVLTRRVPAVETLGAASVLCVDKTGTLTQNRMTVRRIVAEDFHTVDYESQAPLPEEFHEVVEYSILASQIDPFDPMEKAFKLLGDRYLKDTEHLHANWTLAQEYPLSREMLAMSHVWKSPDSRDYVIAAKGAPEAIVDLCHLGTAEAERVSQNVSMLARDALRVLAVAKAHFGADQFPDGQHDFDFTFVGLIGLEDPIRPTVPSAVDECHQAGIRVVMITGDYPETAMKIAEEIRLDSSREYMTGAELDATDDATLRERVKRVNIFARVVPEQKLQLVDAIKADGQIVAMTGDGVNDAPALKSADIGIAMGARGTDVAREASDLVLLDDDFSSIVAAVKMGRRIFDNLKKAIAYILAVHVPIAGLSLIPVVLGLPLVLYPVHIVFLELIIDPACSVVFEAEAEEPDAMRRKPRDAKAPLFGRQTVLLSLLQGSMVLAIVLAVFMVSLRLYRADGPLSDMEIADARTLTFTTLIIANLALIFTNRSWTRSSFEMLRKPNAALWWVVGGTTAFLTLVLYVPFLRNLFHFSALRPTDLIISLVAGLASILWFEIFKRLRGNALR